MVRRIGLVLVCIGVLVTLLLAPKTQVVAQWNCGNSPQPRLQVGDHGRNSLTTGDTTINVRPMSQGVLGEPIYVMQANEEFDVIGGPICSPLNGTRYLWLEVHLANGVEGWIVEGSGSLYFVEPYPAGQPFLSCIPEIMGGGVHFDPTNPVLGLADTVSSMNIRAEPWLDAPIIGRLPQVGFALVDGPVCADSLKWWLINACDMVTGWIGLGEPEENYVQYIVAYSLMGDHTGCPSATPADFGLGAASGGGTVSPTPDLGGRPEICPDVENRLTVDQQFRAIDDGEANNVRANPGGNLLFVIPEGGTGTVIGDDTCQQADSGNRNRYIYVEVPGMGSGWAIEAQNDRYLLEPYSEGGSSNQPSSEGSVFVEVNYFHSPFNESYTFRVDVTDQAKCVISNGAEIVVQEIRRSTEWFMTQWDNDGPANAMNQLRAYLRSEGYIDQFRLGMLNFLANELGCQDAFYWLASGRSMDDSGLGNVLFGYYSFWLRSWAAHLIANLDQFFKRESFGHLDYPDDSSQIDWGRRIAEVQGEDPIDTYTIPSLIPDDFVSST